jgi:hypothetical protein
MAEETTARDAADEALKEGVAEFEASTWADPEAPTIEELRATLGDDPEDGFADMSDDEVMEAWKSTRTPPTDPDPEPDAAAVEADAEAAATADDASKEGDGAKDDDTSEADDWKWQQPWTVTADGSVVEDKEQLQGIEKVRVKFNSGGAEAEVSVAELVRAHQLRHQDKARIDAMQQHGNQLAEESVKDKAQLKELQEAREYWNWAMQDPTGKRLQTALEKYHSQDFKPEGSEAAPAADAPTSSYTPDEERMGEQVFQQQIKPYLSQMASQYSPDGQTPTLDLAQYTADQLESTFRKLVQSEGTFMQNPAYARARLQQILEYELPEALERGGYRRVGGAAPAAASTDITPALDSRVETLEKELKSTRAKLIQQKLSGAPGAGGIDAGPPASGDALVKLDKVKSASDMRKLLDDPNYQFGL